MSRARKPRLSTELTKVVTPAKVAAASKKLEKPARSQAWKGLETAIANAFKAVGFKSSHRRLKHEQLHSASKGQEIDDVEIKEAPFLKLDGKYSQAQWNKVEKLFLECERKYVLAPEDRFALVTQQAGSKCRIAHIRLEFLAELAGKAYLAKGDSDVLSCPRCVTAATRGATVLNLTTYTCPTCCFTFATVEPS